MIFRVLLTAFAAIITLSAGAQRRFELKLKDFKELRVEANIPVDYFCNPDSAGNVVLYADKRVDQILFDTNKKGRLTIMTDENYTPDSEHAHVIVYSSGLDRVTNCGDSILKITNLPPVNKFKATLIGNGRIIVHGIEASQVDGSIDSGNGQLILSGKCQTANLRNVGAGTIQADNLQAPTVKVSVLGTGAIGCDPTDILSIKGAGSGEVFYRTTPAQIRSYAIGVKHYSMSATE